MENDISQILTSELVDNQLRVFKWVIQSLLGDVEIMKIHFISRVSKDNKKHEILGSNTIKTKDLIKQVSLNMNIAWGNFRSFIDIFKT